MVEVTVPDDGRYTGGDLTSLIFVSSSISPPYNGLSFTLPIPILEERAIGITVQILLPLAPIYFSEIKGSRQCVAA